MVSNFTSVRRARIKIRRKQGKINAALKKRLFGHLFMAPCRYCLQVFMLNELTIEHIRPLSLGGTNEDSNIGIACPPCNNLRGRLSWIYKLGSVKQSRTHEQHSSQHHGENREGALQGAQSPDSHR